MSRSTVSWPAARVVNDSGSTTALLALLTGTPVSLQVLDQQVVTSDAVPQQVRITLGARVGERLLLRRSALLGSNKRTLSMNDVVARVEDNEMIAGITTSRHTPIGTGLALRGVRHQRKLTSVGRENWAAGRPWRQCACREYLVLVNQRPVIFIHEAFNPELFLLDEAMTDQVSWHDGRLGNR